METRRPRRPDFASPVLGFAGRIPRQAVAPGFGPTAGSSTKEGGTHGLLPHGNAPTAAPLSTTPGALGRAVDRLALAIDRLPGGICGHDLALRQVHAR